MYSPYIDIMKAKKDPSWKHLPSILKEQGKTIEDWLEFYKNVGDYFLCITGKHWRDWYEVAEQNDYQLPSLWDYWKPHFNEADQNDMAFNCAEDSAFHFGVHPEFESDEDYWETQEYRQYKIAKELSLGI